MSAFFRAVALGLFAIALLVAVGLSAMAVWFQFSGMFAQTAALVLAGLGAACVVAAVMIPARRKALFSATLGALVMVGIWWSQIPPSNDRQWAPELAQTVTAEVDGSQVTFSNIRNFVWRNSDDFDAVWESQTYDIDTLDNVDAVLSYWGIDKIAHVLVSFGFEGGEHLVFSVEIRRELGEEFSELGGLFKQFELSLIAAKEQDILFLRTNARDPLEDVYVYPLRVTDDARRDLFLSYVNLGNQLAKEPNWYNTITANCTTVIFRLVKHFTPDRRFDLRFLLSGGLPEYFAENDMIIGPQPLGDYRARAAISGRAQAMRAGEDYSRVIRDE